jgi:predicted Zn finger-like uncharacterized protein
MADTTKCPGCQAVLRVRADMAGKQIKCPRCARLIKVGAHEAVTPKKPPPETVAEVEPIDDDFDDAPVQRRRSRYEPCPRCGAEDPQKVAFTFWGSFYFTRLFSHVRCQECGYAYNGRTGRSNIVPAIVCISIMAMAILGVLGFIVWFIYKQGYFDGAPK